MDVLILPSALEATALDLNGSQQPSEPKAPQDAKAAGMDATTY
jgi:hypothetical protein